MSSVGLDGDEPITTKPPDGPLAQRIKELPPATRPAERAKVVQEARQTDHWQAEQGKQTYDLWIPDGFKVEGSVITIPKVVCDPPPRVPLTPSGYRLVNPPVLVPDGTVREEPNPIHESLPNILVANMREDPAEALRQAIADTILRPPPLDIEKLRKSAANPLDPTFTIFGVTADGKIDSTNAAYLTARSGGSFAVDTTGTNNGTHGQQEFFGFDVIEALYGFDTSAVTGTIVSALLSLFGAAVGGVLTWTSQARLLPWGPTVTSADFTAGASLTGLTLLATFAAAGWSTSAYNDYTSDANFIANLNTAGTTYLMCSSSKTAAGTSPGLGTFESVTSYTADDSGTTRDPKLTVVTADSAVPYAPLVAPAAAVQRAANW